MDAFLERRAAELHRRYKVSGGLMSAGDVAIEEACSVASAANLIRSGKLGPVYRRNKRVVRVRVDGYVHFLERATIIVRSSA